MTSISYTNVLTHTLVKPARRWCFTINNPELALVDGDWEELEKKGLRYAVYQYEKGEKGTPHFQGYLELTKPKRISGIKKIDPFFEKAHFTMANGTAAENKTYCTKEEGRLQGPWEYGQMGGSQGERSDLLAFRDAVKSGLRGRQLVDVDALAPSYIKYQKGYDALVKAYSIKPSRRELRVTFHYGPAGTGKTFCCHSEDAYMYDGNGNGFWLGYEGQSKVCASVLLVRYFYLTYLIL